jgi:hypothetical protein
MRGTIRQRLTMSVVSVTAVMLALLVLGFNLSLRSSLDGDVDRLLDARAQATLESVDIEDGKLEVSDGADDGAEDALVWVYADEPSGNWEARPGRGVARHGGSGGEG